MTPSRGQLLARAQLGEVVDRSDGALEIVGDGVVDGSGRLRIELSIATAAYRRPGGLPFRARERLYVLVPRSFPFAPPVPHFAHRRYKGTPHVQWGSHMCLYQSVDAEWLPADGMYGFVERLDQWMAAAGAGTLDPDDAPLHPPVAYPQSDTRIVARADAPDVGDDLWVGRADLVTVGSYRRDLVGWASLAEWDDVPSLGTPALAVLLPRPLPMEYPSGVNDLLKELERAGVPFGLMWRGIRLMAAMTPAGEAGHVVLGAPMRRKAEGHPLRQHLTVWEIDADALQLIRDHVAGGAEDDATLEAVAEWLVTAKVGWCGVLEDRPEIVVRRDGGAILEAVRGRRVALLGCGALGSSVAETLVRGGAAGINLVDKGIVRPGLLVRQRYSDADVGRNKAHALKARLDAIGLACETFATGADVARDGFDVLGAFDPDLVIDATASRAVAHRLETDLDDETPRFPIISMTVGAAARFGSVSVRTPATPGGPLAVERRAKLTALARDRGHPLVDAFWPRERRSETFQPEPGCSDPTFVGSAADVEHHAAGLLNLGLRRISELPDGLASMDLVAPPWATLPAATSSSLGYVLDGVETGVERVHGYRVFASREARVGIESEMRRIARVRSDRCETGGLIFGEIDDAHGRVWIDAVGGPPPDSEMSPERFLCGTVGTAAAAKARSEASGGSSGFIGIWHTHPVSRGSPSAEDMAAMVKLLLLQSHPPRQVAMLIVGYAAKRPAPALYLFHRDDIRVVEVDEPPRLVDA